MASILVGDSGKLVSIDEEFASDGGKAGKLESVSSAKAVMGIKQSANHKCRSLGIVTRDISLFTSSYLMQQIASRKSMVSDPIDF